MGHVGSKRKIFVMKYLVAILVVTGSLSSFAAMSGSKQRDYPDKIFVNGQIWTGDDARKIAEALAIKG